MTDEQKTKNNDRSKAYAAAEKRLRQKYHTEFQNLLREELSEYGLEPVSDKRRAKAEADLAKIKAQFPDLVTVTVSNGTFTPSGLDEFAKD